MADLALFRAACVVDVLLPHGVVADGALRFPLAGLNRFEVECLRPSAADGAVGDALASVGAALRLLVPPAGAPAYQLVNTTDGSAFSSQAEAEGVLERLCTAVVGCREGSAGSLFLTRSFADTTSAVVTSILAEVRSPL